MIMGGQAGARGYLLQAFICVLDSLEAGHNWIEVTIEPNDASEKVDIVWQYNDSIKAVQVKSSQNQITFADSKKWASTLEQSIVADAYELRLLGPCSKSVATSKSIGKVQIPLPQSLDLQALLEQAAHKLDHYLFDRQPSRRLSPSTREIIARSLCHQLGSYSTLGASISRQTLDALLTDWIREVFREGSIPETASMLADVSMYLHRFQAYHSRNLPPLIPTHYRTENRTISSNDLLLLMNSGLQCQIIGPPGFGKTLLVRHMALEAAKMGQLPILVRANEYSGNLNATLDRAVSAFCPCSMATLLSASHDTGYRSVLVIDGFNECNLTLQEQLLFDLQSLYLRWQLPIVITSQSEPNLSPELSGQVFFACELDADQRQAILQAYLQCEPTFDSNALCQAFRSGYELSIAATCFEEITDSPNRASLFDAYIRVKIRGKHDALIVKRLMAEIAGEMRIQFCSSLALSEVERITVHFLEQQQVSISAANSLINSGFLDIEQGICVFRHELLQRYFEAMDLAHSYHETENLLEEIVKPANHNLIEFILGMESDSERFFALLKGTAHISSTRNAIVDCLRNHFGTDKRNIIEHDIRRLFDAAQQDLRHLSIHMKTVETEPFHRTRFEIQGSREWSPYQSTLWHTIGLELSHGLFLEEALHLITESERTVLNSLAELFGDTVAQSNSVRSQLFSDIFVLSPPINSLPAARLMAAKEWLRTKHDTTLATLHLTSRFDNESEKSYASLYLLLELTKERCEAIEERLPRILHSGWNSHIYHLQLKTLQYIQYWANSHNEKCSLSRESREAIMEILSNCQTPNIMLNTQLVETMNIFGMLTLNITIEDVRSEISKILLEPDDEASQHLASIAISNIFEDVYQNLYFEAIEELDLQLRGRLFSMASQAVPHYALSASFILEELLKTPVKEAARAFERFSTELDGESFCMQETAKCFILAQQGAALFRDIPWPLADTASNDRKAWQCYGEMFFWMARRDLTATDLRRKCLTLWAHLSQPLRLAAIDPLIHFASSRVCFFQEHGEHTITRLFKEFLPEVLTLFENGLSNRQFLTSIDTRISREHLERQQTTFLIHTLGQIGNASTVHLLLPFVNDDYYGNVAVEAIRSLRSGRIFTSLEYMHRLP